MEQNILVIDGKAADSQEALKQAFTALYARGFVKESFLQGCIEREEIFPTGLALTPPIAIPHTDPIHVNEAAVCVVRLASPVIFRSMEDPAQEIPVEFLFNLALRESGDQLAMLQAILSVARDGQFLQRGKTLPCEEFRRLLAARLAIGAS